HRFDQSRQADCASRERPLIEIAIGTRRQESADHFRRCRSRPGGHRRGGFLPDRKSTRLNSSHSQISYAVFCLKKKTKLNLHPGMIGRLISFYTTPAIAGYSFKMDAFVHLPLSPVRRSLAIYSNVVIFTIYIPP